MKTEKILLIGFALSSMAALIYEVVWAKEVGYVFGASILCCEHNFDLFHGRFGTRELLAL